MIFETVAVNKIVLCLARNGGSCNTSLHRATSCSEITISAAFCSLKSLLPSRNTCVFSHIWSPVNSVFFCEDLTPFFALKTPEQEAVWRRDVFPRAAFGSVRFNWGEKKGFCRRVVQNRLLILVPLNYSASRNAGGIWVFLWDPTSARAKPNAWQKEGAGARGKPARWQTRPVDGESVSELACLLCFYFLYCSGTLKIPDAQTQVREGDALLAQRVHAGVQAAEPREIPHHRGAR